MAQRAVKSVPKPATKGTKQKTRYAANREATMSKAATALKKAGIWSAEKKKRKAEASNDIAAAMTVTHLACISFLYMAYTLGGRDCARFSADKSFGVLRECDSPQEV